MRRRARTSTTIAVAVSILGIGTATAATPADSTTWEPPYALENDVAAIVPVIASTTTDGTVAAWIDHQADEVRAAVRPPGQPWGSPARIGGSAAGRLDVTPMPEAAAVVTWCTDTRVLVRRLRGDGTWAAARPIAAQVNTPWCHESFHVDASGSGAMAVTWEREAAGPDRPRLTYRSADGQWQPAEPIPVGHQVFGSQVVDVAVDTRGVTQVVFAELRDNLSVARLMYLRRSPAGVWSTPSVIASPAPGSLRTLDHSVASDDHGNLAVGWQRPSADFGPETVRAAYRPAGADSSFGPTRVLAEVPYPSGRSANFAVDMSATGRATVGWLSEAGGETVVRSARSVPGTDDWGDGRELYRPASQSHDRVDVAVNADGEALVTILDESVVPSELRTVTCPTFGACGPAELVPDAHPTGQTFAADLGPTAVAKLLWTDPCGDGCQPRTVWSTFGTPTEG